MPRAVPAVLSVLALLAVPAPASADPPWWAPAPAPVGAPAPSDPWWEDEDADAGPLPAPAVPGDPVDPWTSTTAGDPVAVAPTPAAAAPATSGPGGLRGVPFRALIIGNARRLGLEPAFVAAVVHAESGFDPRARSRVGARGLMQLMPATARGLGASVGRLYDPATNIRFGTLYLAQVKHYVGGSVRLAAAAYNAGPGAVRRFRGVPPYAETRAYVRRVVALRAAYLRR